MKLKMENKICNECKENLPLDKFTIDKKGKFGRASKCRECRKIKDAKYRKENRKKETERMRNWREKNPNKAKESYLKYRIKNIDKLKKQALEKQKIYRQNPFYKFKESIRNNIRKSMIRKNSIKKTRTTQILGCSFDEFRNHIELQFESWMNWDNRGLYNGEFCFGWDLDHIIPISSSNTEDEVIKLNHYTNFQPLCSKINRDIKKDKY
jgi:hypothetical protein